jgi:DNA (cytosine-5)-methyltransferase 1
MDMRVLPAGGLLLASPACQGFSGNGRPGRGRANDWDASVARVRAKHQADRNTSWAVLAAADTARPEVLIVENVPEFLEWPIFPAWRGVLEALGYHVRTHTLNTQHYGGAQDRTRAIITAGLRNEIVLEQEVAKPKTIAECLERDAPAGTAWAPIASKTASMQERMRHAQRTAGAWCFWSNVDSARGRPLDGPFPTVTTKSIGQFYLLAGDVCRMLGVREIARAQSFPDSYQVPSERTLAGKLIGNAIDVKMAAAVIRQSLDQHRTA